MSERRELSDKQKVFRDHYIICFNATEAARVAGYKHPNTYGPYLVKTDRMREEIDALLKESAMSAEEVLARLSQHASSSMADFLDFDGENTSVDLNKARDRGQLGVIKRIKQTRLITTDADGNEEESVRIELELYDSQSALVQIGRYHKLFTVRHDVTTGGEKLNVPERVDSALGKIYGDEDE